MYTMRKGERKVMEVFWDADQPMSHSDLCAKMNGTMSKNTLYLHLNRLLDHDLVEVESLVRRGRTYGRTFRPAISRTEYYAMQVAEMAEKDHAALEDVIAYLLTSKAVTNATLDAVEARIAQKRKELNG